MSMVKQFFLPWISCLSFLSVVAAQLDGVIQVSWFLVFIPLFFLDGVKLLFLLVHIYLQWRKGRNSTNTSMQHKSIAFLVWILLLLFQMLLCVYLDEYVESMKLYYVFIPLWIVLVIQVLVLNYHQVQVIQNSMQACYCS